MSLIFVICIVNFNMNNLNALQKLAVCTGLCLVVLAVLLFTGSLFGVFDLEPFTFVGHSGLRTLAGIAVAGCLLAAIGYWDE